MTQRFPAVVASSLAGFCFLLKTSFFHTEALECQRPLPDGKTLDALQDANILLELIQPAHDFDLCGVQRPGAGVEVIGPIISLPFGISGYKDQRPRLPYVLGQELFVKGWPRLVEAIQAIRHLG